jgi:hypothetical protein
MNNLLLEMLAAHASSSGNPAVDDLVARMRGSSGVSPNLNVRELISQQARNNPLVGVLAKHFAESRAHEALHSDNRAVIDVEPEEEVRPEGPVSQKGSAGRVNDSSQSAEDMSAELKMLRERSDLLASALGACCLCWGHDPRCRICRGRGRPGFSGPDEALVEEFVLPAVRMLRAQRAKVSGSSPPSNTKTTETGA